MHTSTRATHMHTQTRRRMWTHVRTHRHAHTRTRARICELQTTIRLAANHHAGLHKPFSDAEHQLAQACTLDSTPPHAALCTPHPVVRPRIGHSHASTSLWPSHHCAPP